LAGGGSADSSVHNDASDGSQEETGTVSEYCTKFDEGADESKRDPSCSTPITNRDWREKEEEAMTERDAEAK